MKADDIKGLAVVSISTGAKLGYIDGVLFDTANIAIGALRTSADGQEAMIPFDQIRSIGSDAVTVPTNDVAQWATGQVNTSGMLTLDEFKKLKVVDEAGTYLGTINEVDVDPTTGKVTSVQAHKGGILGIGGDTFDSTAADIVSIGPEVMVVREPKVPE